MANPFELLAQAASGQLPAVTPVTPVPNQAATLLSETLGPKKETVAAVADAKKLKLAGGRELTMPSQADFYQQAVGRATGTGVQSRGEIENDLATLTEPQLLGKYGAQGTQDLLLGSAEGTNSYSKDISGYRNLEHVLSDTVSGIGSGVVNAVGGIGALGAGLVDANAGAYTAGKLDEFNKFVQGTQSTNLNARRQILAAKNAMTSRDNTKQFEADSKVEGETVAGLRRIGRDFLSSMDNAMENTATLSDGISQGIGSLLTAGPLGKVVSAGTKAVIPSSVATAATGTAAGRYLAAHGGTMVGIGIMEGGGAYQQSNVDVMEQSYADLEKNSPMYRELVSAGQSPEAAKRTVANRTGLMAAAIQAPISAATGALVAKFEGAPLKVPTLRQMGGNLIREKVEEGLQSGSGQLAQNFANQTIANDKQVLSEGVGEQAGTGALYGLGTAAAIQAPGLASHTTMAAFKGAAGAVDKGLGAIAAKADAVRAQNDKASPVSVDNLRKAVDTVAAEMPESIPVLQEAVTAAAKTPEQTAEATKYVDDLVAMNTLEPGEADSVAGLPLIHAALIGATDRLDAVHRLAKLVNDSKDTNARDAVEGLTALQAMLDAYTQVVSAQPEAVQALPEDHPAREIISRFGSVAASVSQMPEVSRAMGEMQKQVEKLRTQGVLTHQISDVEIGTPEGQRLLGLQLGVVQLAPERADLAANRQILAHAAAGRVQLSEKQRGALAVSTSLLEAAKAHDDAVEASGVQTRRQKVTQQIRSKRSMKPGKVSNPEQDLSGSAVEHARLVYAAVRDGNNALAADYLGNFALFVEHMGNKVGALNEHFAAGKPRGEGKHYRQLDSVTREWRDVSNKVMSVNPFAEGSVAFAQEVKADADFLAQVFNGLVDAFPDLGVSHIEPTALNPLLVGNAKEVAKAFSDRARRAPVAGAPAPAVVEPAPKKKAVKEKAKNPNQGELALEPATEQAKTEPVQKPVIADTPNGTEEAKPKPKNDVEITKKPKQDVAISASKVEKQITERASALQEKVEEVFSKELAEFLELDQNSDMTVSQQNRWRQLDKLLLDIQQAEHIASGERISSDALAAFSKLLPDSLNREMLAARSDAKDLREGLKNTKQDSVKPDDKASQKKDEVPQPTKKSPVSTGSSEDWLTAMSDAELNDLLNPLVEQGYDNLSSADQSRFDELDGEMTRREDAAVATAKKEEQTQVEPVVEPVQVEETQTIQDTEPKEPTTVAEAYPSLVAGEKNEFHTSFKLKKTDTSRIRNTPSPLKMVLDALKSTANFTKQLGGKSKYKLHDDMLMGYSAYLRNAPGIVGLLNNRLNNWMTEKSGKSTRSQYFLKGDPVNTWIEGRVLNIAEHDGKRFQYNQQLVEGGAVAALQWVLQSGKTREDFDEEQAAKILGIPEDLVTTDVLRTIKSGSTIAEAVRGLASKITDYWGVQKDNDAPRNLTEGIPQSLATELLAVLIETGAMDRQRMYFDDTGRLLGVAKYDVKTQGFDPVPAGTKKNLDVLQPKKLPEDSPLRKASTLIDSLMLENPGQITYMGDDVPPVAKTQMRNALVPLTDEQQRVLKKESETEFRLNRPMLTFYKALGLSNMQELFGGGPVEDFIGNVNFERSLVGKNQFVQGSLEYLLDTLGEASNRADNDGKDLYDYPIKFAYNFSKVNRMQMLGAYNPQSNKIVREAVLPTWSTLDLSDPEGDHFKGYMLSLAQALGISVHTKPLDTVLAEVSGLLDGPLSESVALLQEWNQNSQLPTAIVNQLKQDFASIGGVSPIGLHAVMDYARMISADDAGRAAYRTAVYLEADGVTNGTINAMMLLTPGAFTADQIYKLAKGGVLLDGTKTMDQQRAKDPIDSYQESTNRLKDIDKAVRASLSKFAGMSERFGKLDALMDILMPDATLVERDGEQVLELKRGIAKSPMMITIYGSGAKGIAGNLVNAMLDELYERMSVAAQSMEKDPTLSPAEAFFGTGGDADARFARLETAMAELTRPPPVKNRKTKGYDILDVKGPTLNLTNFKEFTLEKEGFKNLQANMKFFFVDQLRQAIHETVGTNLMENLGNVRMATQVQSIFLAAAYKRLTAEAMAKKAAENPGQPKSTFLSQNEQDALLDTLKSMYPIMGNGAQNLFVAGSESSDVPNKVFSSTLDGQMPSDGYVYGPVNSGVKGIPYLVLSSGDGMAMQIATDMPNPAPGTLKIFDGVNLPPTDIKESGRKMNQAVWESWKLNPMRMLADNFQSFMKSATKQDMNDPDVLRELASSLGFPPWEQVDSAQVKAEMGTLARSLEQAANEVEARHYAFQQVNLSIDQMAATGVGYQVEGGVDLTGASHEAIAAELNKHYQDKLDQLSDDKPVTKMWGPITENGEKHPTGVYVLNSAELNQMLSSTILPGPQKEIVTQIRQGLGTDGFTLVAGSMTEIQAYQAEMGMDLASPFTTSNEKVGGWMDANTKTLYLVNPTSEILTHEMIHAATFNTLVDHYEGNLTGQRGEQVAESVARLEVLMDQFMDLEDQITNSSNATQRAYVSAMWTIRKYQNAESSPMNAAAALNEFMAWTLANPDLTALLKRNDANPLVRIAKSVLALIKHIFWGKKDIPVVGKDMFSNVQFNTGIIIRQQMNSAQVFRDASLSHTTQYGNSDRLTALRASMDTLVNRHLDTDTTPAAPAYSQRVQAVGQAVDLAVLANKFFPMNMQEMSTFKAVVATLATQAKVDPVSMGAAQKLFTHVIKNLKVEMLMADPDKNDPNDRTQAQAKYDMIMGNYTVHTDVAGRSSLLPVFLGLAVVNADLRDALAKMDLPKTMRKEDGTVDSYLQNTAKDLMEGLSAKLSGIDRNTPNVKAAIDALSYHLMDIAQDEQSFLEQSANAANGFVARTEEYITDGMQALSDKALALAKSIRDNSPNKVEAAVAALASGVGLLVSEKNSQLVAEDAITALNRTNAWKPFKDFAVDLVGRTASNATIYDMIKAVRAMVQQDRQQFREDLPTIIAGEFSRKLEDKEWKAMTQAMIKTDLASLVNSFKQSDILEMLTTPTKVDTAITSLEGTLSKANSSDWSLVQTKAKQLAKFMVTGKPGRSLLRNAEAVSLLLDERRSLTAKPDTAYIQNVDKLITLYALKETPAGVLGDLSSLVQKEQKGLGFALSYLVGQRAEEQRKAVGMARLNSHKGHINLENQTGVSLLIASDSDGPMLAEKSYVRVGDYQASNAEVGAIKRGYYYAAVSGRPPYNQGIVQNVRTTAGGVDQVFGHSVNRLTAGVISDPQAVKALTKQLRMEGSQDVGNLMPIFAESGAITGYERSADPAQIATLNQNDHFAQVVGQWRGRQVEELRAKAFNEALVDNLFERYEADKNITKKETGYVNLLEYQDDPVIADGVKLLTPEMKDYITSVFGPDRFMVRKDMINDVIGYRAPSIGDAWSGNSRWSPETLKRVKSFALATFGNEAYRKVVNSEQAVQNFVKDARTLIVVKSVVVPVANFMTNILQMVSTGVPMAHIVKNLPRKISEIHTFTEGRVREVQLEAQLRAAAGNLVSERKLKTEIKTIQDSYRRLSIWPLIERGEFSSISDAGISREELLLTNGKIHQYMERLADKLPGPFHIVGRYGLVTKDTALFQGIQRAVEYSDFLAKSLVYDDLVGRKKQSHEQAAGRITEEFVNFDRLPGRFRGGLENLGLLWFWNFKIRSVKVALSMVRNNPLHTLLASLVPIPSIFGNLGTPVGDNLFSKLADGSLSNSIGFGQGLAAPALNPWVNLAT